MATHDQATVSFVADHPWATLLVGPAFAAITGVAVKEGLCYGKLEAAALALVCSCLVTIVFKLTRKQPLHCASPAQHVL